jgi:hypothetical protein
LKGIGIDQADHVYCWLPVLALLRGLQPFPIVHIREQRRNFGMPGDRQTFFLKNS